MGGSGRRNVPQPVAPIKDSHPWRFHGSCHHNEPFRRATPLIHQMLCGRLWFHLRVGRIPRTAAGTVLPAPLPAHAHRLQPLPHEIRMDIPSGIPTEASGQMPETHPIYPWRKRHIRPHRNGLPPI